MDGWREGERERGREGERKRGREGERERKRERERLRHVHNLGELLAHLLDLHLQGLLPRRGGRSVQQAPLMEGHLGQRSLLCLPEQGRDIMEGCDNEHSYADEKYDVSSS